MRTLHWGSFKNHVDKILTIFDHPTNPRGQAWTFRRPPTGSQKKDTPAYNIGLM